MEVNHAFTANLAAPGNAPVLHAVQYDGVRRVTAQLYAGTAVWTVPEGVTAGIGYTLPNRQSGYYESLSDGTAACIMEENMVTAVLAPILTSIAGETKVSIILTKDGTQLSTFPFRLRVAARPGEVKHGAQPDAVNAFVGKLYYGAESGIAVPLGIGAGLEVQDGALRALADPDGASKDYVDAAIDKLWADINYKPIAITSVSIQPSVAQIGAVIEDPTVSWAVSKTPVEQTVNGASVEVTARSEQVEGSYSAKAPGGTQSVTVRVVDERGAVATKSATMTWHNAVYYTSHWPGGMPQDADLIGMEQVLQAGRGVTINAQAGEGEYVLYACPKRMGTPEFWANGFQGGFRWLGNLAHYNAHQYREEYSIYISEAAGLTATITVK